MAKKIMRGSDVMLFVDGKTIALATSCDIDVQTNTIECRTKDSPYGPDAEFDYVSWTANSESFVGANKNTATQLVAGALLDLQLAGQTVQVALSLTSRGGSSGIPEDGWAESAATEDVAVLPRYVGTAYIKSVKVVAPSDNRSTISVAFEGKGPLTKSVIV